MNDATILEARALAFIEQPRSESAKAWHLPDEQFCDAVKAQLVGVPFKRILEMLAESGLPDGKLPQRSAWSEFWSQFRLYLRAARRRTAAEGANAVADEAQKSPAEFDAATIDLIRQLAFELADSDNADPKDVKNLVSLLLKRKDQELKERQVDLAAKRLELLIQREEAAKHTLGDEQLTPEERDQKMREIFGIS